MLIKLYFLKSELSKNKNKNAYILRRIEATIQKLEGELK